MKLKNLFFAAAAVLGVVACQNKPSVAEGVTVDPAEITFAKEGETACPLQSYATTSRA